MSKPDFVHLHTHSEYSLLDGACRIQALVNEAAERGMSALALTDHGVMYGAIEFYQAARESGIKPIIGCELYLAPRTRTSRSPKLDNFQYHLVVLAENGTGYRNLLKLVSKGFLEGFYYKPRVDRELLAEHSEGLIALTACLGGEIPEYVRAGNLQKARETACAYRDIFGPDNLYLELQDHGLEDQKPVNEFLVQLSGELGLPLVATNDIHYMQRQDASAHQVLLCIQTGTTVGEPKISFGSDEFYFKSQREMAQVFRDHPEALSNTIEIAERCRLELDFSSIHLPHFEPPDGLSAEAHLEHLCREALPRRYADVTPAINQRLEYELKVICEKGLAGYVLIVSDFVSHAKSKGILVGPGRGSGAGCLVCYLLGITNIDPLKYGLIFERFLTPGRITMPDFDLDFADTRREEVIQYVREKYGDDRVAQIITFGTMGAKAAVRDCGRALNMRLAEVDRIARMVPETLNITLEDALKASPELRDSYERNNEVRRLLDTAKAIEGLARHSSVHAAGVLISKDPLTDHVPLQRPNEDGSVVAGFDKNMVAQIGLLKIDVLGLRTLSVMGDCIKMAAKNRCVQIDLNSIPFDDEAVYRLLQAGETAGVFQLESSGMRQLLKDLRPARFEDVIPVVGLFRPGPLGSGVVTDFVKRKRGDEPVVHLHERCAPILEDTYGVLLYQEQVMRIAMELASFSAIEADGLRSAMAKKKHDKIQELRPVFVRGAAANGIERKDAETIYNLMASFGSYGFNKSHTACYAVLAYQTAYLKVHYPAEFMAALLTSVMDNKAKVAQYVDECRRMKLSVLPPDINKSYADFSVESENVRFGLAAIKNVGRGVIDAILQSRGEEGEFVSLHDLCRRVCDTTVTRSAIECLIRCGAFDSINKNRNQLLFVLGDAMNQALRAQRDKLAGQVSLFGGSTTGEQSACLDSKALPPVSEFSRDELLAAEKDLLGLYISDHPLLQFEDKLTKVVTATSDQVKDMGDKQEVVVGGVISRVRNHVTKKNNEPMVFLTVEDLAGPIDVTVFPSVYKQYKKSIVQDGIVVIRGKTKHRERPGADNDQSRGVGIICETIHPLSNGPNGIGNGQGKGNGAKGVTIRLGKSDREKLKLLKGIFSKYSGDSPVFFLVPSNGGTTKVSAEAKVEPSPKLLSEIERLLGPEAVKVE